jgi:glutathione S-transferase
MVSIDIRMKPGDYMVCWTSTLLTETRNILSENKCTIADIAHFGWIAAAGWAGIDINEFPALKSWEERMLARPGVEKGRHVPDPNHMKELLKNPKKMEEEAAKSRAWVQAGMKEDAKTFEK